MPGPALVLKIDQSARGSDILPLEIIPEPERGLVRTLCETARASLRTGIRSSLKSWHLLTHLKDLFHFVQCGVYQGLR